MTPRAWTAAEIERARADYQRRMAEMRGEYAAEFYARNFSPEAIDRDMLKADQRDRRNARRRERHAARQHARDFARALLAMQEGAP